MQTTHLARTDHLEGRQALPQVWDVPQGDRGRVQEVRQLGAGAAPVAGSLRARSRRRGAAPQQAMLLLLLLLKLLLTCWDTQQIGCISPASARGTASRPERPVAVQQTSKCTCP